MRGPPHSGLQSGAVLALALLGSIGIFFAFWVAAANEPSFRVLKVYALLAELALFVPLVIGISKSKSGAAPPHLGKRELAKRRESSKAFFWLTVCMTAFAIRFFIVDEQAGAFVFFSLSGLFYGMLWWANGGWNPLK